MERESGRSREGQAIGVFLASTVAAVLIAGAGWLGMRSIVAARTPVSPIFDLAEDHGVDPLAVADGWNSFAGLCAVCHGRSGEGVQRLGKPLRNNPFVQSLSDEELTHFIVLGRAPADPGNTTGVPMPPRGGNPRLTDFDIASVVAFLRTIQDPAAPPSDMSAWVVERPTAPAGAGPGHQLFISACSACHGADAAGLPGLGKSLRASEFVASKSDAELAVFVKSGRPIWDAENTTGVDMPPKGGNPALTDEQLAEIIRFIRSVHE